MCGSVQRRVSGPLYDTLSYSSILVDDFESYRKLLSHTDFKWSFIIVNVRVTCEGSRARRVKHDLKKYVTVS